MAKHDELSLLIVIDVIRNETRKFPRLVIEYFFVNLMTVTSKKKYNFVQKQLLVLSALTTTTYSL